MEDVFNKIIEIDENAKKIVSLEKEKKENIENYIESEFNTKKVVLDLEFKDEIQLQKNKYQEMFNEKKQEIDREVQLEIEKAEKSYRDNENEIINNIISKIKRGEVNGN